LADPFKAEYYTDSVGRPRKLSKGAMIALCNEYADGASTKDLAKRYGISQSTVLTVVYHTARK
jgi:Mor family transcriptional regulator